MYYPVRWTCVSGEREHASPTGFRYFSQPPGRRSSFAAGISINASDWRHLTISTLSFGRMIRNAHQKSRALQFAEPAFNDKSIAKFGGATIVDLSAYDHRISLSFRHFCERKTELFGQECAYCFDEPQIGDI